MSDTRSTAELEDFHESDTQLSKHIEHVRLPNLPSLAREKEQMMFGYVMGISCSVSHG
jgi:hypothetical protein